MKEFLKKIYRRLHRNGEEAKVLFGSLLPNQSPSPSIEELCRFDLPHRIFLGDNVRFLRGCVVAADTVGRILIGSGCTICRYAIVQSVGGEIGVGPNSLIGDFCNLYGQGGLLIGKDVMIASGVRIIPNAHQFNRTDIPIRDQPCRSLGIQIEDDVFIGTNAVILDGVKIGKGSVIGAGSVIIRTVPAGSVVAGVPGRVIRNRTQALK